MAGVTGISVIVSGDQVVADLVPVLLGSPGGQQRL